MRTDPVNDHPVKAGKVSSHRSVPDNIAPPSYASTGRPPTSKRQNPKSDDMILKMRQACALTREVLDATGALVTPGISTDELDVFAHDLIVARGAYPSTLNYQGFRKSICTSVNEVICHGIPDSRKLNDGDIVNVDVSVFLDGVHGDCSAMFGVGCVDGDSQTLIRVTRECLEKGIEAVRPDRLISEVGRAIERHAAAHGYGVVKAFTGHGIGENFHMSPQVLHYYDPNATDKMLVGLTFTIEPMITMGTYRYVMWDDGWTVVTADLQRTAQFEHTILVTDKGAEILTGAAYE